MTGAGRLRPVRRRRGETGDTGHRRGETGDTGHRRGETGDTGHRRVVAVLTVIPLAFIGVFFVWPVGALVVRAVGVSDGEGLLDLARRTDAWGLLGFTLAQAAGSTLVTLVVAAPIIWLVATCSARTSTLLMVGVTIPFVLPTVVVGMAFRAIVSPGGPLSGLGLDGSVASILAAHAFLNIAVVVRVVGSAWRTQDPRAELAARTLGATPWRAFTTVVLPRLIVPILSASALVFLFCSTSFGVVLILGNGRWQTIETAVYTQAIGYFDLPAAVTLSLLQIVVVIVVVAISGWVTPRTVAVVAREATARVRGRASQAVVAVWAVVVLVGPLSVVVIRSLRPTAGGEWTLSGYRSLTRAVNGQTPLQTLQYSVVSALWAMVLSVVIGLLAAIALQRARGTAATVGSALALVPLGVSAVTVGFGYLIVLASLPAGVASWPGLIPAVQALIAVPVVIRVIAPALAAIPPRLRHAAATLGAGPWRVWRTVDLPLIWRPLAASGAFAFIIAVGEFGATGFLARPGTTTLPVLIGSALNRPGADNLATAMACSVLMIVVTAIAVVVMESFRTVSGGDL
ncbi:ABC transporter permease [Williamsia herbipolensis]|uniref:ABC transporter permease n=1 Tax=Williamsia herbipolensis TaxID=1603258 RepID=UPI000AD38D5B